MMLPLLRGLARVAFVFFIVAVVGTATAIGIGYYRYGRDLPDFRQITGYVPATGSKVFAEDGTLIAEFEAEHRIPVAIANVPRLVIQAFLAAEDRDFYTHKGVDPAAIVRAALADITRMQRGQRPMGASTITQQVVRHFLLSREVAMSRKIKEAILAYRIEHALSKDRILEIYLNEIYLGAGAYGVAAAADTYFQKPLDRLTLAEAAYLAALPKAPNNYHPIRNAAAAKARRDWVIAGMAQLGWITEAQANSANAERLVANFRGEPPREHTGHFVEEVRRELVARFGEKAVYGGGMTIRTSYRPNYQQMAEAALRKGLVEYDRRHGWRGPLARLGNAAAARSALTDMADPPGIESWQLAAVTATDPGSATLMLRDGSTGRIPLAELRWARPTLGDQRLGPAVRRAADVLAAGDIVLVEPLAAAAPGKGRHPAPSVAAYGLRQLPDVGGGVVVMDPQTGRVFALVGGWSFQQSQFNRATQAKRQPGSAFKPFVYATALTHGFTPASIIEDAPLEIAQGPGLPPWRPVNYEGGFMGAMTLEEALIRSRNLVTARIATMVGLPAIAKTVQDFDIMDRMPPYYAMSLGAGETTLLRLTNAYAMLDNGGHWLLPSVIDVVQDRAGGIVYQKGVKGCASCFVSAGRRPGDAGSALYRVAGAAADALAAVPNAAYAENPLLYKPTKPDPLLAPDAITEIVSIMQGVVERGTAVAAKAVGKPLAGKTGTTSDWVDAWFVGFSRDLVAGAYVGFDEPRTLGEGETGGRVAVPIFRDFMMVALKDKPARPFPLPPIPVASAVSGALADEPGPGGPEEVDGPGGVAAANGPVDLIPDAPQDSTAETAAVDDPDAPYRERGDPGRNRAMQQPWLGYAAPYAPARQRGEFAAGPGYPPPWVPPDAPTGWGAPYAPPHPAYQAPAYAAPNWGPRPRPGAGTGGLY